MVLIFCSGSSSWLTQGSHPRSKFYLLADIFQDAPTYPTSPLLRTDPPLHPGINRTHSPAHNQLTKGQTPGKPYYSELYWSQRWWAVGDQKLVIEILCLKFYALFIKKFFVLIFVLQNIALKYYLSRFLILLDIALNFADAPLTLAQTHPF